MEKYRVKWTSRNGRIGYGEWSTDRAYIEAQLESTSRRYSENEHTLEERELGEEMVFESNEKAEKRAKFLGGQHFL